MNRLYCSLPGATRRSQESQAQSTSLPQGLRARGLALLSSHIQPSKESDLNLTQTFPYVEKKSPYVSDLFSYFQQVTFRVRNSGASPDLAQVPDNVQTFALYPTEPPGDAGVGEGCLLGQAPSAGR